MEETSALSTDIAGTSLEIVEPSRTLQRKRIKAIRHHRKSNIVPKKPWIMSNAQEKAQLIFSDTKYIWRSY